MPTLGAIDMDKTYFYNVQTKSKVGVKLTKQNAKLKKTSNGRYMLQVTYDGSKMSRFVGSEDKKMLERALGKGSKKSPTKRSRKSRKTPKRKSACNKKKSRTCKKPCSWVRGSKGRKGYCRK
jgi:isochorismate hydrolase